MPLTQEELEVVKKAAGEAAADSLKKKMDAADDDFQKAVAAATEKKASAQDLIAIQEKQQSVEQELKGIIARQGEEINKLSEGKTASTTWEGNIRKGLKENEAAISALASNSKGEVRFKAVTPMTLGSFGERVRIGQRETEINKRTNRLRYIFELITVILGGPGSDPLSWVERRPKEGGAAFVAESAIKPGMDWTYTEGKVSSQFIAVNTAVTRNALLSWQLMEQEINETLTEELYDTLDEGIIRNSAASSLINSLWSYAKSFTGSALASKVNNANYYDVIRAAILQVRKGNPADPKATGYRPSAALVSLDVEAAMDLEKGSDGHYILPPFLSPEGTAIKGVPVIGQEFLGDDEFEIGDFSKYLFNIVNGIDIMIGYIDKQFVQNQATIQAELYGMGRVKYHDTWAFVKGDFTTAKAALELP